METIIFSCPYLHMIMKDDSYEKLLTRIEGELSKVEVKKKDRIEIPKAETFWIGQKTFFRNFSLYPKLLRRTSEHFLMFLSKELATSASLDGDRAIFIGRKLPIHLISYLNAIYVNTLIVLFAIVMIHL